MGACLEERLKSRRSARPALRSEASLSSQPSAARPEDLILGGFLDGAEREAWALARAPKEMLAAVSGSELSESDYEVLVLCL